MSALLSSVRSFLPVPSNNLTKGIAYQYVFQQRSSITTSQVVRGKRNIRKFFLGNKRGTKLFRRERNKGNIPYAPVYTEVQTAGFNYDGMFHTVPEMVPEFIVPDLTDCPLKPYVSYKAADIYQTELNAQDLFDILYKAKIGKDFEENKLNEDGTPMTPSEIEKLSADEAWIKARQTGSDLFNERTPRLWECLEKSLIDDEEPQPQIQVASYDLTHPSELKKKNKLLSASPAKSTAESES